MEILEPFGIRTHHMSQTKMPPPPSLLAKPVQVINVGLERFAQELAGQNVPVAQVAWVPPAGGDAKLAALLSKLAS